MCVYGRWYSGEQRIETDLDVFQQTVTQEIAGSSPVRTAQKESKDSFFCF